MKKIAILFVAGLAVLSASNFINDANAKTNTVSSIIDGDFIDAGTYQVRDTMVLGKLYFANLEEGEQPVMAALSLFGDRCGSGDFNHKPCSAEGIRSVFELNEWIEFHPQASAGSGIKVMVFAHKTDQGFYLNNPLDDETPGYVLQCDLNKDSDDETYNWGSFYLHPEEVEPGCYDFVFIYKGKVFATMLTRFFKEEELYDKSDSELEELMSQSPF
ncbi:MAG: hypothetical protein IKQ64_02715 [Bacteroidales bacterium]|nr:hypothetical protein [Bacteroidales bacterium]